MVAISSKLSEVFHLLFNDVVIIKLYSVSGSRLVTLIGGLFLVNSISFGSSSTVPFWFTYKIEFVKLSARSSRRDRFVG